MIRYTLEGHWPPVSRVEHCISLQLLYNSCVYLCVCTCCRMRLVELKRLRCSLISFVETSQISWSGKPWIGYTWEEAIGGNRLLFLTDGRSRPTVDRVHILFSSCTVFCSCYGLIICLFTKFLVELQLLWFQLIRIWATGPLPEHSHRWRKDLLSLSQTSCQGSQADGLGYNLRRCSSCTQTHTKTH